MNPRKLWNIRYLKVINAFLDQGLYSIANFGLSLLLPRWVTPVDYGGFSVGYSIVLLLTGVNNSFVYEPISVFGPKRVDYQRGYLQSKLFFQFGLSIVVGAVGFLIFSLYPNAYIHKNIWALLLAYGTMQLHWFLRRIAYIIGRHEVSSWGSIFYSFVIGFIYLEPSNRALINPFISMTIASVAGSVIMAAMMAAIFIHPPDIRYYREWFGESFSYGIFILVATLLSWVSTYAYTLIIDSFISIEQAGLYKVLSNLVTPFQQLQTVFYLLLLPWLSSLLAISTKEDFRKKMSLISISWVAGGALYALGLIVFRVDILKFLYQQSIYSDASGLVIILGAYIVICIPSQLYGLLLRVFNQPKGILYSKIFAAVATIVSSLVLLQLGIVGILYSMVISAVGEALILVGFYHFRRQMGVNEAS